MNATNEEDVQHDHPDDGDVHHDRPDDVVCEDHSGDDGEDHPGDAIEIWRIQCKFDVYFTVPFAVDVILC